jgi:hypothetical protein
MQDLAKLLAYIIIQNDGAAHLMNGQSVFKQLWTKLHSEIDEVEKLFGDEPNTMYQLFLDYLVEELKENPWLQD